ncbi:Hypothetical protein R9X50_00170700 [Acrodontium crateriforme]|uniref:Early meiotic induction protein 1 n=1 Tax=Acrodontium crateriforme TaxID=150365 RepID=A0AAQ3M070_9PEZI|nr:Hypothetical protein R9X50_00170700 [Acrodontium crateriforme]
MGWLWSSSPKPAPDAQQAPAVEPASTSRFALSDDQRARIFGPDTVQPKNDPNASRDQQADAELDAFLQSFAAPGATPSTSADAAVSSEPIASNSPPVNIDRLLPDGSPNIDPAALYPRTMSCRQAFDQAFYCQSLGGKFNDLYRYGHVKDCSEQWGAFWFCMRTRTYPEKEKENHIREYYAQRDERRRQELGSSERIWDLREKAVEKAFWKDPDADEGGGERKEMMVKG